MLQSIEVEFPMTHSSYLEKKIDAFKKYYCILYDFTTVYQHVYSGSHH